MSSNVKVVLTGACATGKTSIITKLIYNTFDPNYISTEGGACGKFQFTYEEFNDYELTMDIWDTAGQERYKSLTKIFYKNAEIAILVYEITNKKSFTDLKDYWIPQLKEAGINDIGKKILYLFIF
jgi:small GTP-binding protein